MTVTLIRPNGESLTLDSSPSQSWFAGNEITSHPIEDRTTVSEHVQGQPRTVSIPCRITESPMGEGLLVGPARIQEALRFLNAAGDGGELLEVESRLGLVGDYILKEWPHDVSVLRNLSFNLSLQQVRIAEVQVVRLPREVPRVEVADTQPPEDDVGTQPTQEVSEEGAEAVSRSWALSFSQRLFGGE